MFFGVIVEKDDDDDDEGQKLKSIEDEFYGDESQGVQVKVRILMRISARFSTQFRCWHVGFLEQHRDCPGVTLPVIQFSLLVEIFVHKRKHKKSQFHKLSHESFCCMRFEMFQIRTFNNTIEFL